jgi:tripartite-type tricarboxylate transporter receptor subunit TctC
MSDYYIAVFESTHHAMSFEKTVKEGGFKITIMPVPREITASCGLSAKIESKDFNKVKELAEREKLRIQDYYHVEVQNSKKTYHKST